MYKVQLSNYFNTAEICRHRPSMSSERAVPAVWSALGSLSYGLLILTTNALPRWIGVFGIAGGIVAPFGWLLFVDTNLVFIGFIGLMIALFFGLISGAWLIWKRSEEAA